MPLALKNCHFGSSSRIRLVQFLDARCPKPFGFPSQPSHHHEPKWSFGRKGSPPFLNQTETGFSDVPYVSTMFYTSQENWKTMRHPSWNMRHLQGVILLFIAQQKRACGFVKGTLQTENSRKKRPGKHVFNLDLTSTITVVSE